MMPSWAVGRQDLAYFECPFGCGDKVAVAYQTEKDGAARLISTAHAHEACALFKTQGLEVARRPPFVLPIILAVRPRRPTASRAASAPGDIIGDPGDLGVP